MKNIKLTDHFYLHEFIHPNIYNRFQGQSQLYISETLVELVEAIRVRYGKPIWINTWAGGGSLINSGLRDYVNPLNGKLNRSRHYYGLCADLHAKDIEELQDCVWGYKTYFKHFGLRVIEDYKYTKSWLHVSVEWTGLDRVKIIKP